MSPNRFDNGDYETPRPSVRRYGLLAGTAILGLFAIGTMFGSWYTIDQGHRGVLLRWGKIVEVVQPGLHFKSPWIEGVSELSVRTGTLEWAGQSNMEAYSRDQQPAKISIRIAWHIPSDEKSVQYVYSQFKDRDGVENAILQPRALEAVKNIFGQYDAVDVIQKRQKFNIQVENELHRLIGSAPVILDGVQVQDIAFSDAYEQAVEARMTAQVQVQKLQQQALQAKINAEITVTNAKASADAKKLAGDAEAYAIQKRADALKANEGLVTLTAAEKWDGHLPQTMIPGSTVPFLKLSQ